MSKPEILIVEDQLREGNAMVRLLTTEGYQATHARTTAEALQRLSQPIDLVICDVRLGVDNGVELLKLWKQQRPSTRFIMVTAYGEVHSAVNAMKLGAEDYLTKPVDPGEFLRLVRQTLERDVWKAASLHTDPSTDQQGFSGILGRSPAVLELIDRIQRASQVESQVLILGESGTGKELVASAIHQHSRRNAGPYVAVNIAAVPESLIESELFGYVKGAFTGAGQERIGRFEAAHGGTLFIDEIGDFPLASQAKLLRVLENLRVNPVGSNEDRSVDVRVIAATSRNLTDLVANGSFRADLFYRLNVVTIQLPPLRERQEDLTILIDAFVADSCERHERRPPGFSADLLQFLHSYDWPGNVRQLRNTIENMIVMCRGDVLSVHDLPAYLSGNPHAPTIPTIATGAGSLQDMERTAILSALDRFHGNRTHAAEALGISVRTLQRKLKAWGVGGESNEPID
ncbi:MAG: Sigma-54 dependent transcriptional regulator/response regulator [Schlesneria sp.]|nr:Sigma-54 dependent transcriptional regulator/response regulator [Schlesneria sp.]